MKIAYVYPYDFAVWRFRRSLIEALIQCGHAVAVICPEGAYRKHIEQLGVQFIPIRINRFINPLGDLRFLLSLYTIFRREQYDMVHNFTIKPNVYGALAARLAGVKTIVSLVPGLGYAFAETGGLKLRVLRQVASLLYRIGFACTDRVWFQNPDDLQFFVGQGLLSSNKAVLIKGSGVNTDEFCMQAISPHCIEELRSEFGISNTAPVVVMPARATRSKGVPEYIKASRIVALQMPDVLFLLMGVPATGDPGALSEHYLKTNEGKNFRWLGFRPDIRELLALAKVVVLPSFYREGIPRSLLEALALAKPIITTDSVGCRETVENGKNGILIPKKNAEALADAILALLRDDSLTRNFGQYSRQKAEDEFSERRVIEHVFTRLYGLPAPY